MEEGKEKVRRTIIVLFSWLLCVYQPAAGAADLLSPPVKSGALFSIQNASHTLYLFGTIHVGTPDFYPLEARAMQAMAQAPVIALELDPGQTQVMQAAVQKYGLYPPGQTFKTALSPTQQRPLLAALKKYNLAPDNLLRFKPWMLAMALTLNEFIDKGYQPELAIDSYIANYAQQHDKPIVELEGAAAQMALFGQLNDKQQISLLQDTIRELSHPDTAQKVVELAEVWRTANVGELESLLRDMRTDHSVAGKFATDVLLDQRNPKLADGIAGLLQKQDQAFAAIGILHLAGPNSVPALLEQRGYRVQRIY